MRQTDQHVLNLSQPVKGFIQMVNWDNLPLLDLLNVSAPTDHSLASMLLNWSVGQFFNHMSWTGPSPGFIGASVPSIIADPDPNDPDLVTYESSFSLSDFSELF